MSPLSCRQTLKLAGHAGIPKIGYAGRGMHRAPDGPCRRNNSGAMQERPVPARADRIYWTDFHGVFVAAEGGGKCKSCRQNATGYQYNTVAVWEIRQGSGEAVPQANDSSDDCMGSARADIVAASYDRLLRVELRPSIPDDRTILAVMTAVSILMNIRTPWAT